MRDGLGVALLLSAICTGESMVDRPSEIATLMGVGVRLKLHWLWTHAGFTAAEEAQTPAGGYRHWLTDLAPPLSGVDSQHWFPDNPGSRFTVGEAVSSSFSLSLSVHFNCSLKHSCSV